MKIYAQPMFGKRYDNAQNAIKAWHCGVFFEHLGYDPEFISKATKLPKNTHVYIFYQPSKKAVPVK